MFATIPRSLDHHPPWTSCAAHVVPHEWNRKLPFTHHPLHGASGDFRRILLHGMQWWTNPPGIPGTTHPRHILRRTRLSSCSHIERIRRQQARPSRGERFRTGQPNLHGPMVSGSVQALLRGLHTLCNCATSAGLQLYDLRSLHSNHPSHLSNRLPEQSLYQTAKTAVGTASA